MTHHDRIASDPIPPAPTCTRAHRPVRVIPDPIRGSHHVMVMCEVFGPDGTPHPTNTRAKLRALIDDKVEAEKLLYGFEQEYTMLSKTTGNVLGWPVGGYPAPQGPFYCGVGAESAFGRPLAEAHLEACMKCGINISGINAEVMPGQWEYQIGPVGPLEMGDEVMLSRWLLYRLGEDFGIVSTLTPKPVKGDWNGTGAHTNFSTEAMRNPGGMKVIEDAIEKLSKTHVEHITQYGLGNEARLTGKHETCDINTFKYGVADRGSSIRIPLPVMLKVRAAMGQGGDGVRAWEGGGAEGMRARGWVGYGKRANCQGGGLRGLGGRPQCRPGRMYIRAAHIMPPTFVTSHAHLLLLLLPPLRSLPLTCLRATATSRTGARPPTSTPTWSRACSSRPSSSPKS